MNKFNEVYQNIIAEENKQIVKEGLFGLFNKSKKAETVQPKQQTQSNSEQTSSSNASKKSSEMPGIFIDTMQIDEWNDILNDIKKAASDCKTKDVGDMLLMDINLLKKGKQQTPSSGGNGEYDPNKMTILKNIHPESFKDMIEDIRKAAEICQNKELKDALKMDLAILKKNI